MVAGEERLGRVRPVGARGRGDGGAVERQRAAVVREGAVDAGEHVEQACLHVGRGIRASGRAPCPASSTSRSEVAAPRGPPGSMSRKTDSRTPAMSSARSRSRVTRRFWTPDDDGDGDERDAARPQRPPAAQRWRRTKRPGDVAGRSRRGPRRDGRRGGAAGRRRARRRWRSAPRARAGGPSGRRRPGRLGGGRAGGAGVSARAERRRRRRAWRRSSGRTSGGLADRARPRARRAPGRSVRADARRAARRARRRARRRRSPS